MSNNGKKQVTKRGAAKRSDSDDEEEVEIPVLPVSHPNYLFDLRRTLKDNQYRDVDSEKQRRWIDRAVTANLHDDAMGGLIGSLPSLVTQAINNTVDNEFPPTETPMNAAQQASRKESERRLHNQEMMRAFQDNIQSEIERLVPMIVGLLMLHNEPPEALDNLFRQVRAMLYHTTTITQFGHGPDDDDYGKGSGHPSKKRKDDK